MIPNALTHIMDTFCAEAKSQIEEKATGQLSLTVNMSQGGVDPRFEINVKKTGMVKPENKDLNK